MTTTTSETGRSQLWADVVVVAVFVTFLATPAIVEALRIDRSAPLDENRSLATRPDVPCSWTAVKSFPVAFSKYFRDHVGLRNSLVRWYARLRYEVFAISPKDRVLRGKEGWLFLGDEFAIESTRGRRLLTERRLDVYEQRLSRRAAWLAKRGIRYVYVVCPNKHTIYEEFLPEETRPLGNATLLDQFVDRTRRIADMELIDLRESVRSAKDVGRLYHLTDTHWNELGAFVAAAQITEVLRQQWSRMESLSLEGCELVWRAGPAGDLAKLGGLEDRLREKRVEVRVPGPQRFRVVERSETRLVTEIDDASLPAAVIFRDSFATALQPFLSNRFRRIVYEKNEENFDEELVRTESPDLVVTEVVERKLLNARP